MIDELGVETVNWFTCYDNGDTGLWLERERECVWRCPTELSHGSIERSR